MTIVTSGRRIDVWCDGCGARLKFEGGDFYEVLDVITDLDWITVPNDRGYGIWYEHFCSLECTDDYQ